MRYLFLIILKHQCTMLFYRKIFLISDIHCVYCCSCYTLNYFVLKRKNGFRAKVEDIFWMCCHKLSGSTFCEHLCSDVFFVWLLLSRKDTHRLYHLVSSNRILHNFLRYGMQCNQAGGYRNLTVNSGVHSCLW